MAGGIGMNVRSLDGGRKEDEEHAQDAQRLCESAPLSIEMQRHGSSSPRKFEVSQYYRIQI